MQTNKLVALFISIAIFVFMIPTITQLISPKEAPDKYTINVTSNTVSTDIDPSAFKEWVAYWVGNDNFSHFNIKIGNESHKADYIILNSHGVSFYMDYDGDSLYDELLKIWGTDFIFDTDDNFSETYPGVITITPVLSS